MRSPCSALSMRCWTATHVQTLSLAVGGAQGGCVSLLGKGVKWPEERMRCRNGVDGVKRSWVLVVRTSEARDATHATMQHVGRTRPPLAPSGVNTSDIYTPCLYCSARALFDILLQRTLNHSSNDGLLTMCTHLTSPYVGEATAHIHCAARDVFLCDHALANPIKVSLALQALNGALSQPPAVARTVNHINSRL